MHENDLRGRLVQDKSRASAEVTEPAALEAFYSGKLPWLARRTILLAKGGSHAYGTNRPDSDLDIRGICVPPSEYFFGFSSNFEQAIEKTEKADLLIYSLRKWFSLAAGANPNILEIVWQDPSEYYYISSLGKLLIDAREDFLSKRVINSYGQYALSQLSRIKTHRRWLLNPPSHKPTRAEFNLPDGPTLPKDQLKALEAIIAKKVESWSVDLADVEDSTRIGLLTAFSNALTEVAVCEKAQLPDKLTTLAAKSLGLDSNFLDLLARERSYRGAVNEWASYESWKLNRNEARAELERKFGYDVKHASHLKRLLDTCKEILVERKIYVKRPNADELKAILSGAWSYEKLIEYADSTYEEIKKLGETCELPAAPNYKRLDSLCRHITVKAVYEMGE